jgi:Tol biopolymer transport system component
LATLTATARRSSANGLIVFQMNVHGTSQLFTISPDGSGLRQVTHLSVEKNDAGPESGNWSPDGSTIIFDSDYGKTSAHKVSVFTIHPDGSGLTKIRVPVGMFDSDPAYSHDGRLISFALDESTTTAHREGIAIVNADGSTPRRVTELKLKDEYDERPNWSPDDKWLAFTEVKPNGQNANFKVMLDGTGLAQLTPWSMDANNAKWSPDGKRILFNSWSDPSPGKDANIYTMNPDGTGAVQLTHYTGGKLQAYVGGWSPDGRQIVFHVRGPQPSTPGLNQLFVMNADGSHAHELTHTPTGTNPSFASWGTRG